jgi:hypothetical protein
MPEVVSEKFAPAVPLLVAVAARALVLATSKEAMLTAKARRSGLEGSV